MSRRKKVEVKESSSSSSEEEEYSSCEEDREEQYDPTSEEYNPLRALYYPERAIPFLPWPDAPTLDNLAKYSIAVRGKSSSVKQEDSAKSLEKEEDKPSTSSGPARRFLPHQEPIAAPKRKVRNVMTRMEAVEGPLAALRDAMEKKIRVKVVIRGMAGWAGKEEKRKKGPASSLATRGELLGAICAFDRHWNIAMEDVTEVFRRRTPKHKKTVPTDDNLKVAWPSAYRRPPRVKVLRKEHRYEVCERYLGQVMVRGEQVAFVAIA